MPARDLYHQAVKAALIADGWTITHDPYRVGFGGKDVYISRKDCDMDALSRYRQIITGLLSDLAEAGAQAEVDILPVFDTAHDNYLLVDAGWDGVRRIHHIIVHLRLRNGKVWVEADNTDARVVQQLLDAGLTKDEIVLAFYSPRKRPLTEFAVA
jgi:hypothetical protein